MHWCDAVSEWISALYNTAGCLFVEYWLSSLFSVKNGPWLPKCTKPKWCDRSSRGDSRAPVSSNALIVVWKMKIRSVICYFNLRSEFMTEIVFVFFHSLRNLLKIDITDMTGKNVWHTLALTFRRPLCNDWLMNTLYTNMLFSWLHHVIANQLRLGDDLIIWNQISWWNISLCRWSPQLSCKFLCNTKFCCQFCSSRDYIFALKIFRGLIRWWIRFTSCLLTQTYLQPFSNLPGLEHRSGNQLFVTSQRACVPGLATMLPACFSFYPVSLQVCKGEVQQSLV